eukprot:gnl/MRDRNA2_/MRDRNA2_228710_c0_seq1.p1 gnl/MRDRNA2_/MRDRNA2_228710_c0~~gnl/MRDRNA2_/MRDRNA2_228710_c0_seq1.p1  ORF type:complete len:426 (+),score=85.37 gnl/MRDRNA2_/MRDRNA2_228710_c0_seq1:97-1374(+)
MRSVSVTILVAVVVQAHVAELHVNRIGNAKDSRDKLAIKLDDKSARRAQVAMDNLVDILFDRALKMPRLHHADVEDSALAKPGSTLSRPGQLRTAPHPNLRTVGWRQPHRPAIRIHAQTTPMAPEQAYAKLTKVFDEIGSLPPSQRAEASEEATKTVKDVLNGMKAANYTTRWDSYQGLTKENIFMGSLKQIGIKDPESIGQLSNKNDLNFLLTVVGSTSILAVAAQALLPGDWGFFSSYLIGGISIGTLAIGSTAPGLLAVFIDQLARVNPEYQERIARHEAAHFLVGYAMGVPVAGYSLGVMIAHTDFLEAKLEEKLYKKRSLTEEEMLPLACTAMAGAAAEALQFEDVQGQEADLRDLQQLLNKVQPKMTAQQQMQTTRWAVWKAAQVLKKNQKAYDALTEALKQNKPVADCFKEIESAPSS